ncbi:MAG: hypothetical protein M3Q48_07755 [Actinomycetota bacterium]|nr:hypothetical protein [Actinomycetota bacterium]
MFSVPGGDPEEMLQLARVLETAAADLRRLVRRLDGALLAAGRPGLPVLVPLARTSTWAAGAAGEVRRRARQLADDERCDGDGSWPPPFGGAQRGKKNLRLTDAEAQTETAKRLSSDSGAPKRTNKAAKSVLKKNEKQSGDRRSRPRKDAKPSPADKAAARRARGEAKKTAASKTAASKTAAKKAAGKKARKSAARKGTTFAAVALGVWWAGKALSPACGPAAPACAVIL